MMKTTTIPVLLLIGFFAGGVRAAAGERQSPTTHDGQHDFDFAIGTWKTHARRLLKPLTGSTEWVEGTGTVSTRKVWHGRASLEELTMDTGDLHLQGLALRLYDPKTRLWRLHWANVKKGLLITPPSFGSFKDGRGEFYDAEIHDGKDILLREIFSEIKPGSHQFEQAFSPDFGKTWEPNIIVDLTRTSTEPAVETLADDDRNRDFDFQFGHWKIHVSKLEKPLTGSTKWLEYDGISEVTPVWNGRANLIEIEADGSAGHIEGLGLRLHDPQARQWNLNWATSSDGILATPPTIGAFKDGRGEFYDQELIDGHDIIVRNTYTDITADSSRYEQAFSADAGKTWEKNWVVTFARQ